MKTIWNIIEIATTLFENYIVLDMIGEMFGYKYSGLKKTVSFLLTLTISTIYVTIINQYFSFEGWLALITIIIFTVYSMFCTQKETYMKLLIPIIALSVILSINMSVTYIFGIVFGTPDTFVFMAVGGARLLALFLTKLLFFVASRIIIHIYRKEKFQFNRFETFIVSALFLITLIISISLVKLQLNHQNEEQLIFLSIFCVFLADIFIFCIMKKINKESQNQLRISMLELQLSEQKTMIEETGNISREIKKAEHDLRHHLLSILGNIENGNTEAAETYLKQLLHDYETSIFKYIYIDNSAVNSILNMKISRCHANKIDIKTEIESDFSDFSDIDICVLLANLLDNAIEASLNVDSPQITVSIRNEKNYLCILIRNRIESSVLEENGQLHTTKKDKSKHGLGVYSISQIVDKYDGMKNYYEKNGYFVADIWLKKKGYTLEERIKNAVNYQTRQN